MLRLPLNWRLRGHITSQSTNEGFGSVNSVSNRIGIR
jgi:hypothetical protein